MALKIEGATLGYDANNIQSLLNDINTQVITDAKRQMHSAMSGLRDDVNSVWVGASAEKFKSNMDHDIDVISQALDETFTALTNELNQVVNKMDELDRNLVQGRS